MTPEGDTHVDKTVTFERIEEYKAILDNLSGLTTRRQYVTNIYVGLNSIFLTALGIFVSNHLNFMKWDTAVLVGIITMPILVLNLLWLLSLSRYSLGQNIRYKYLRGIEHEFRNRRGSTDGQEIGLFTQLEKVDRFGAVHVEMLLVVFFLCLYLIVSIGTVLATWLVQNHAIPPLSL